MKTSTVLLVLGFCLVLATLPQRGGAVLMSLSKRRNELRYRKTKKARQEKKAWQRLETIVEKKEDVENKMKHIRTWMRRHYKQVRGSRGGGEFTFS